MIDDLEAAAIKLRTFSDRIRRATRGYSGLFDAVKVNEKELASIYQYDAAMLDLVDEVGRAIDNVEASLGSEGLPASIRHLKTVSQQCHRYLRPPRRGHPGDTSNTGDEVKALSRCDCSDVIEK